MNSTKNNLHLWHWPKISGVFVKIISIPDEELFSETAIGCTALYIV